MRFERLERLMVLEKVRTGETEHEAGFPMARQYRQTAITVALFGGSGVLLRTQQLQSSVARNRQDTTAGLQGRTKP